MCCSRAETDDNPDEIEKRAEEWIKGTRFARDEEA